MAGGLARGNKKKEKKKKWTRPKATVPPSKYSKNSNGFEWICLNDGLPLHKKFRTKYGFVDNKIRNNFPYRNFSRFEMKFELKFSEAYMS
jgi:hypothetical protein